jgi:hypothetical protein
MITPTVLVLFLVGGLLVWKLGSVVLRMLGGTFFLLGLLNFALKGGSTSKNTDLLFVLAGMLLWLAGHWLFAFRHHVYRSRLAQRVFIHFLSGRLDPTRKWGIRMLPAEPVQIITRTEQTSGEEGSR